MSKNRELAQTAPVRIMLGVLMGALAAFVVCVGLLAAAAAGISTGAIGEGRQYQLTLLACVAATAVGGGVAVLRCKTPPAGLGTGLVFYLCLLTVGVVFFEARPLETGSLGVLFSCLAGGALSGLLGLRRKRRRRR